MKHILEFLGLFVVTTTLFLWGRKNGQLPFTPFTREGEPIRYTFGQLILLVISIISFVSVVQTFVGSIK
jgi:hypothetical protein